MLEVVRVDAVSWRTGGEEFSRVHIDVGIEGGKSPFACRRYRGASWWEEVRFDAAGYRKVGINVAVDTGGNGGETSVDMPLADPVAGLD